jgi:hypothetical protein
LMTSKFSESSLVYSEPEKSIRKVLLLGTVEVIGRSKPMSGFG